jgi:hypothetical protein
MYHAVIGRRLVSCVNQRSGTNFTVRDFFDQVFMPLFFGSPRLMLHIGNSPFDQALSKQKREFTPALYDECLAKIHSKVATQEPDASFFLGGPAAGSTESTSGQVTSLALPLTEEDVYASWLGAALGVMVQGGITLLLASDDALLTLYEGWSEYRRFLEQTPKIKPLQINTWNGQWLTHHFGRDADLVFTPTPTKDGGALETVGWVQLLFALSHRARGQPVQQILAYVYSLGQINTTIGFVRLHLSEVRRPVDLYRQLFTVPPGMPAASFERLYETANSFRRACEQTEIGLRAIKPKDTFKAEEGIPKPPKTHEGEKQLAFDTFQTWIIAMLNNKDFLTRAEELAAAFYAFAQSGARGTRVNSQLIENVLETQSRRLFIERLTELVKQDSANCSLYNQTVEELLTLSPENVTLFLTLLRFKYATVAAKPKENAR